MERIINRIMFVVRFFYIFISEGLWYMVFRDYDAVIERITCKLASLNILCVKVFQAFALNNSLIDVNLNNHLIKFTDNAPWSIEDVRTDDIIKICEEYNLVVPTGYDKPINSGMISLVFKAEEVDTGKPMIIKLKRKNIHTTLKEAIQNISLIMYLLSFIKIIDKYQLAKIVDENIDIIHHQTNFIDEISNMETIRINCEQIKYIKIPIARKDVTEKYPNAILMEFIDGMKQCEIEEADYEGFAKQVMKFGFITTAIHGVTHGDMHCGNILFIKDEQDEKYKYKIGVIDFGIIHNIDEHYRSELFDILANMFIDEPENTAIKLLSSSIVEPTNIINQISKKHRDKIVEFTASIIKESIHNSKNANQLQIYKFISILKEYFNDDELADIGIRPSVDFIKTQLVLAMSHGVTLTLCKNDFMPLANIVLNELFHTELIL